MSNLRKQSGLVGSLAAVAVVMAAAIVYAVGPARTSDHQDSPTTVARPGADITDVYVFPAANSEDVVLAMNVHPLIPAGMGTSTFFDPGVMYQFKVDNMGDHVEHVVLQFQAKGVGPNQTMTMYGPSAPNMTGTQSTFVGQRGTFGYNQVATLSDGIKVFAGPREDSFYFDLVQFLKIDPDRDYHNHLPGASVPPPMASCFRNPAVDTLSNNGFNVLSIVVEMPRAMLAAPNSRPGKIGVWTTTSVQQQGMPMGTYAQIERLGRPAIKEAFQSFMDHDSTNRSSPYSDPTLPDAIVKYMTAPPPAGAGRSAAIANAVKNVLIPDEMEANLAAGGPARYLGVETKGKSGFPIAVIRTVPVPGIYGIKRALPNPFRQFGGRDPGSPVIDLSLGVIYGSLVPKLGLAPEDGRETPCLTSDNVTPAGKHFLADFPYIGNPR
ncbi:MAG: DUF4331 domain-containing protein [Candidatus Eremiobacteraeota bacterium]|nr:DUF4331 domain-containing protein [Candidatus Eremiobacteraeota bacterium]